MLKRVILGTVVVCLVSLVLLVAGNGRNVAANPSNSSNLPVYNSDGKLPLPANYREWVFLTSGFGMNYSTGPVSNPMFTTVYASPEPHQAFNPRLASPAKTLSHMLT